MHDLSIHPVWLVIIAVVFFAAGFLSRALQIKKTKKKLLSLENDMLKDHAEILRLQQEIVALQQSVKANRAPVVPMKDASSDDSTDQTDPLQRKKFK